MCRTIPDTQYDVFIPLGCKNVRSKALCEYFSSTMFGSFFGVFWRFSDHIYTPKVLFTAHFYHLKFPNQLQIWKNSENFQNVLWKALNLHFNPTYIRSFSEFFGGFLTTFTLFMLLYFSIPPIFTIWNFKVIFVYEKTPKKLPKHFAAKYKLRTFKRTASQVPHRLGSFYGAVSSTTISCRDLLDPKNFQKI